MAMTPREVHAATVAYIVQGDRTDFDRVLSELRCGELVIEYGDEGLLIRAASPGYGLTPGEMGRLPNGEGRAE